MLTQRTRSYFWELLPLCHFWRKSMKKCDRESTDRQTDRRTHALTETNWIYNLPRAICYSHGADNKIFLQKEDGFAVPTRLCSSI